jgi:CubicO group peptidase (beta-lactamase class C family)
MHGLQEEIDSIAGTTGFSGAVHIDRGGTIEVAQAFGWAHRGFGVPNELTTQFAIASGSKGFTAVVVASLVEEGLLGLSTTARSLLGSDLPLIDDTVTVEHLLSHRAGIGDYLDEEAGRDVADYVLPVPVHELATTEDYFAVLDGHPSTFEPGTQFSYCNGGYVVLALLAERVSGRSFHDLVDERVCKPAGMRDTAFLRSDELPGRAATGYLGAEPGARTNVFHLPVRGNGDGGIYSTAADVSAFWRALFAGRLVAESTLAELLRPRSDVPRQRMQYGLGFWLKPAGVAILEGSDAGVSFRSGHDPSRGLTFTVISNTSEGAWPIARLLDERFAA